MQMHFWNLRMQQIRESYQKRSVLMQVNAATMAASSGTAGLGPQGEPSGSQGPGGRRAPASFASTPQGAAGGASRGSCFKYGSRTFVVISKHFGIVQSSRNCIIRVALPLSAQGLAKMSTCTEKGTKCAHGLASTLAVPGSLLSQEKCLQPSTLGFQQGSLLLHATSSGKGAGRSSLCSIEGYSQIPCTQDDSFFCVCQNSSDKHILVRRSRHVGGYRLTDSAPSNAHNLPS